MRGKPFCFSKQCTQIIVVTTYAGEIMCLRRTFVFRDKDTAYYTFIVRGKDVFNISNTTIMVS